MRIIEFKNEEQKKDWNDFMIAQNSSFLQSWEWGEVMRADGQKIWRLVIEEDDGRILAAAMVVGRDLPLQKKYLYVPHGPVFLSSLTDVYLWQKLLYKIKEIALEEQSIFLKIEPLLAASNPDFLKILKQFGFRKSSGDIQPKKTLVLNLLKSHNNLLKEMHSKARYNIRLARKKGVLVRGWPGLSACDRFDIFWRLMRETASREKIRLFPQNHYLNVFKIFGGDSVLLTNESSAGQCELYTAEYVSPAGVNEILASIFVVHWGERAIYLYGASSDKFRNLMAPHLIQWEAILDAKIKGLKYYDFWGINEKKWPGVTRFKKGFGGEEVEYVGAWDFTFKSLWYWIYKVGRRIKF